MSEDLLTKVVSLRIQLEEVEKRAMQGVTLACEAITMANKATCADHLRVRLARLEQRRPAFDWLVTVALLLTALALALR